jgi:flagellar biogenesis protein FliO
MTRDNQQTTRRRWFRFSLGAMLLVISLIAVAAWGVKEHRERVRLEEIVRVQRVAEQRRQLLQYIPQQTDLR